MHEYAIVSETVDGRKDRDIHTFIDDDAAISFAVPVARGRLIEVWRSGRMIATVDERPCAAMVA